MLVSYMLFRLEEGIGRLLQAISYFSLRKAVYNSVPRFCVSVYCLSRTLLCC